MGCKMVCCIQASYGSMKIEIKHVTDDVVVG